MTKIGVIGAGAFGTALACVLARGGHNVSLLGRNKTAMNAMAKTRENAPYLPSITLPENLSPTVDFADLSNAQAVLMVVPAQHLRTALNTYDFGAINAPLVLCAKGIEKDTSALQSDIATEVLPNHKLAVATGPGFAQEIAQGKPTALTLAAQDLKTGEALQHMLSSPTMRLYLSDDMRGAQLGGALKNVLAIACGIVAGTDLGQSALAALMTRGFAETSRLATAMGAKPETLVGLAGFGDMVLTCTSKQSRNFSFGYHLGQTGQFPSGQTYEGVATAQACLKLADKHNVDMPIAQTVAQILDGQVTIRDALDALMSRPLKSEF